MNQDLYDRDETRAKSVFIQYLRRIGLSFEEDSKDRFVVCNHTIRLSLSYSGIWVKPKMDADYIVFMRVKPSNTVICGKRISIAGYISEYDKVIFGSKKVYSNYNLTNFNSFKNEILGMPTRHHTYENRPLGD